MGKGWARALLLPAAMVNYLPRPWPQFGAEACAKYHFPQPCGASFLWVETTWQLEGAWVKTGKGAGLVPCPLLGI